MAYAGVEVGCVDIGCYSIGAIRNDSDGVTIAIGVNSSHSVKNICESNGRDIVVFCCNGVCAAGNCTWCGDRARGFVV